VISCVRIKVQKARRRPDQPFGIQYFLDVVAVGLEQHIGAAQLPDLLLGPLDHAVTFARMAASTLRCRLS